MDDLGLSAKSLTYFPSAPVLGADLLTAGIGKGPLGPKDADRVASRFEGMFWSMLLKEMREGLEPGVMLGEDGGDVLGGMFDLTMGDHMSQGHNLGIAAMIKRHLEELNRHEHDAAKPDAAHEPGSTVGTVARTPRA